jgi:hypothetical protein
VAPIQELFFLPKFYQRKNYRLALETAKPAAFKTSPIGPNNPSTASDGKFCKLTAIALTAISDQTHYEKAISKAQSRDHNVGTNQEHFHQ